MVIRCGGPAGRARALALVAVLAMACAGCAGASSEAAGHTHGTLPAGDGTEASYVGYTLSDLRLPDRAERPGRYRFRIDDYQGTPVTDYVPEQTKKMHVYLVREDLSQFRHLHPTMDADGTWEGTVTVPAPGRYRLVTEFGAVDEGGGTDPLVLGDTRTVGSDRSAAAQDVPVPAPATEAEDDGLRIAILDTPRSGSDSAGNRMRVGVSFEGEAADLGTFLGTYAHLTGFAVDDGALVHMHPLGEPERDGSMAVLTFHTAFPKPGSYRIFVQVRVSGIVRTVPITLRVQ